MSYRTSFDGVITLNQAIADAHIEAFENASKADSVPKRLQRYLYRDSPWLIEKEGGITGDITYLYPDSDSNMLSGATAARWLNRLMNEFFIPLGYQLEGRIVWSAEDEIEDNGVIMVENNTVSAVSTDFDTLTFRNVVLD